jgi:hypothetical protein
LNQGKWPAWQGGIIQNASTKTGQNKVTALPQQSVSHHKTTQKNCFKNKTAVHEEV